MIFNMITLKGIYGREMHEDLVHDAVHARDRAGHLLIITHRFHYTEFDEAFEVMRSGNAGKVVMDWAARPRDFRTRIDRAPYL